MAKLRQPRESGTDPRGIALRVYEQLRDLIVRGRLAPGARITEVEAAAKLGVSRTPLRAALQRLQQEGYVLASTNGRRARVSVTPLTREDSTELMHIIGEIEGLAAHNAARLNPALRRDLVAALTTLNQKLGRVAGGTRPDADQIFKLDLEFHAAFVVAGAGPRLLALHQAIKPQAERYGRMYAAALTDAIHKSVEEHTAIIRAFADGDADAAQRAVIVNWRNAAARLSQVVEIAGERGSW
ncbi:MAG TPA: GntR family transcriptional regulator [Gemmatimonadales bacterium]|nr:GntR family transcriptional regulator [Gemmatimonadales bacterium]